ncbi:flagellar biosynthetic protein FliR [Roseicyclus mahoneyensis]|uniref:Flagellar biosynthetic protein FliR n=1 Tax=Roseicyclus mahoneyensis TaxID=164332 RepID=A0A316GFV1_9RHOB|nr:flagellar biosynthetic protein FliR [Roseicyclus mahoneyensis]PWK59805.1 flagellar biosynthetic protein FliR [Roseicyclus mahoneyensis]
MMAALASLADAAQLWLAASMAVFLRIGACFLVLPGLGEAMIPVRVRLCAALAFATIVTPAILPDLPPMPDAMPPLAFFLTEAVAGLILGLALRLTVHALQIAGSIAAQATSLSQIMGGASPDPQPAMGALWMLAGMTLAVMAGLHVHLAEAFLRSYAILPIGTLPRPHDLGGWGTDRVAASFGLALSLAAPFLLASVLYNVALGVINKAMPQLMVAFVGAPAITWGGLFLMLITTPFLLPVWFEAFRAALAYPLGPP